jgi:hypothetical protein
MWARLLPAERVIVRIRIGAREPDVMIVRIVE